MSNKNPRVAVPANIEELLNLANLIYQKHQADGGSSPLNSLQEYSWDTIGPGIQQALAKHNEAEALKRQSEKAFAERNALVADVADIVKSTRSLLKALNTKNPKKIGDWGFDVVESPRPGKEKVVETAK
ncbi:hypothetical protein GS399_16570 [Pedobacter sp. HMF7647]|uniref:Uncharacterized protein n=1 Tax=Hufsiella arboris TaxID=2695275 RepID=A0A7K1YF25_9SPHI|nr:hypothetical protein [Hufsiella arboris]MXV52589.1 hypothetical protein [Hufsiella arboris]